MKICHASHRLFHFNTSSQGTPMKRIGMAVIQNNKPDMKDVISGGFFVCNRKIFDYYLKFTLFEF
jgi:hypothetical protein